MSCPSNREPSHQDPFETYKTRLAKKLARQAEASEEPKTTQKTPGDDLNWFGVKVGASDGLSSSLAGTGIGKYLGGKRLLEVEGDNKVSPGDEPKKKKRLGFGDFEGW